MLPPKDRLTLHFCRSIWAFGSHRVVRRYTVSPDRLRCLLALPQNVGKPLPDAISAAAIEHSPHRYAHH
jgi:hypothetical protein